MKFGATWDLKLDEELQNIPAADTAEGEWSQLKQATYKITAEAAGFRRRVHHGCFDDNDSEPTALLDDMHQQRITWIKHHIKKATVLTSQAKSSKQTMPDEEQLVGWFSWGTPGYAADEKDSKCFYDNLKKAYGPRDVHSALIRSKDGATLCTNQSDILQRWAEHFNSMLTSNLPSITLC